MGGNILIRKSTKAPNGTHGNSTNHNGTRILGIDPILLFFHNVTGTFSPNRQWLRSFTPKAKIEFERGNYLVKTVESRAELEEVLRLRYDVFHREHLQRKMPVGIDCDRFDRLADHLVIKDRTTGRIVGTYRLISSQYSLEFYSQSEFSLGALTQLPGTKLELSRACIHRDYRTGQVMHLLWRGLARYIQECGVDYLFGMASIWSMDPLEVGKIYGYLAKAGHIRHDLNIFPTEKCRFGGFSPDKNLQPNPEEVKGSPIAELVPPLLQSYLKMGAQICPDPALDSDFRCVDFLTILKIADLNKSYEKRYAQRAAN